MSSNGSGFLEVGVNATDEVVINLPCDMTGHIVFSPAEARALAESLRRQADKADTERQAREEAARIAALPPVDRSKQCTTNGQPVADVRASQTNATGQHAGYVVLCAEERAKGFVRPYRDSYQHVGQLQVIVIPDGRRGDVNHRVGGCGAVTSMGRALSETYARDPTFYGATFCCHCNRHLPVAEFIWTADGQQVGS